MPSMGEIKQLQGILEANPVPTIITRMHDGLVKYANAPIAELVGLPRICPFYFRPPMVRNRLLRK